jgi:hypothetical protein
MHRRPKFWNLAVVAAALACHCGPSSTTAAAEGQLSIAVDGKPVATIVVSAEPSAEAWFAAGELRNHLRKITGADIPIVTDAVTVAGPRLLVGASRATRALDLDNKDFQPQEYLIGFRPDTLVLMGRDAQSPVRERRLGVRGKAVYAEGQAGKSLEFGTGLDALVLRSHGMRDESGTFEAWVWLDSTDAGTLFRIDGGDPWSYLLVMSQDNTIRFTAYGGQDAPNGTIVSQPLTPKAWHQVTAVYDAGKGLMKLFVDGVSQGTAPYAAITAAKTAAHVSIGAFVTHRDEIVHPFVGRMDGIKVSSRAHSPSKAPPTSADTLMFLDCDDGAAEPTDTTAYVMPQPPERFSHQATCYAVYDFLERFCGVRWYAPGDDGTIIPRAATLAVEGSDVRRKPAMEFRDAPPSLRDLSWGLVARGSYRPEDATLFMRRMRLGGRNFYTMHSFEDYYDRFWKQNPKRPEVFEGRHPEYFAQGYPASATPGQLCYSNPALIAQVVKDARAKYDAGVEMIDLVPMDNDLHCRCTACQSLQNLQDNDGFFSSGRVSDLFFSFANKVAAELRKSHPDRFVGTLAYFDYARFPKKIEALEPNILVGPCLSVRNWWCPPMKANDMAFYKQWVEKVPGRIHCLLIYQCFPGDATGGRFKFFPGFHAHMLADAMRMFHEDGVRGIWLNGVAEYIDGYLTCKMMDFADFDVDRALDEFFRLYYGPAAGPMREIHDLIEQTYSNPANYPPSILDPASYSSRKVGEKHFHQTKEMAWKWLGTKQRIDRITALMAEAKAAPLGEAERRHVEAFDIIAYRHLLEGRAAADR